MKHAKKLASLLLALVLVFSLTATAFAVEADLSSHTYKAYQIFSGTQNETENDSSLGNIVWGSGVNGTSLLTALKADATLGAKFGDCVTASDVAEVVATFGEDSAEARAFAQLAYANKSGDGTDVENGTTELDAGYYLVVDVTTFTEDDENTARNLVLLQLTKKGTFEIKNKTDVPEVEKKVKDTNDTTGETSVWQDSADYDIGDSVPFQLKATLASNVSSYTTYKVVFHDTLSAGLTYKNDAKVYIDGNETDGFTVTATVNADGTTTLTVSCDDVKALGAGNSSAITVEYTATLNANAVIGSAGNPNEVYLEYSNNPNNGGEGETGKTPVDKVIVFTYKVIVNKVDGEDTPLTGAAFKLEKLIKGVDSAEDTWKLVKEFTVDDKKPASSFEFTGLDDSTYKLTETVTPAGYNTIDPIYFIVEATHDETKDDPQLLTLTVVLTNENGVKLTEQKDGEAVNIDLGTVSLSTGSVSTDVVNQKGATLPETGGIGTTIFYILGSVLLVGAAILLITKKRMSAEK